MDGDGRGIASDSGGDSQLTLVAVHLTSWEEYHARAQHCSDGEFPKVEDEE